MVDKTKIARRIRDIVDDLAAAHYAGEDVVSEAMDELQKLAEELDGQRVL